MAETHIFNGLQLRRLKICGSNLIAHGHSALDRLPWKKSLTRDLGTHGLLKKFSINVSRNGMK